MTTRLTTIRKSPAPSRAAARRSALLPLWLISGSLLLGACDARLSGKYGDELGIMEYEFESDGTVYINTMGVRVAGEYEIDDDNVIVRGPHGNLVFERRDDHLVGPMGLTLGLKESKK